MNLFLSDKKIDISIKNTEFIKQIDLSALKIANCVGCFGCWTKTPGRCVIRDDAVNVYPLIAKSEKLIYVSKVKFGGYDTIMKTMLERSIPVQQAFLRLLDGETHHVQREVVPKQALIIAYGNISDEERGIFRKLVERNAYNMCFEICNILFVNEEKLEETVGNEVNRWEK